MASQQERPTFSVVIPAHNASGTIDDALRSVLAQTRADFEAIVVDDGSTDDTAARARRYTRDRRIVVLEQENAGVAAARNSAIARMRGRFATLLDSDDLLMPDYLERMGIALEETPRAAWAFTDPWVLDDRTRRIRRHSLAARTAPRRPLPGDAEELLAKLVSYNFVFVACTVRREALEEMGGFDTSLPRAHDYELWVRLAAGGKPAVWPPGHLAIYRVRKESLSTDRRSVLSSVREILRRVAEEWEVPERVRALARGRISEIDRRLAVLDGEVGPVASAVDRAQAFARSGRQRLLRPHKWPASPPPEVAAAFPELVRS